MRTLWVTLGVLVTAVHGDRTLRKCCPLSEKLNATAACISHTSPLDLTVIEQEPWRWVPAYEIDADNATLQTALQNTTIKFGAKPSCSQKLMDVLAGSGRGHYRIFIDDTGQFRLNASKDASLVDLEVNEWNRPHFDSADFCMDLLDMGNNMTIWVSLVCPCGALPCIKKCCPEGQGYDQPTHSCKNFKGKMRDMYGYWTPQVQNTNRTSHLYRLAAVIPDCPNKAFMEVKNASDNKQFIVLHDGSLQISTREDPIPRDMFCGDYTTAGDDSEVVFACRPSEEKYSQLVYELYGAGLVLSAAVLLATVIIQWLIHATNRLHGRLGFTHNCCLVLGFLMLSAIQLGPNRPQHTICLLLAFIIQFSFLAAFFWLNVMCIDISWAFSGFRPPQGSVTERDRKKFLYYSLYAWGSPTLISIVTAIMQFVKTIPDSYIKPDFGIRACWFKEKNAAFVYFYGPMAVLLLVNFALFIYTTVKIILVQRDTRILQHADSSRHGGSSSNFKKDKKRLILYTKLFCLMGLTWITEIISWLHGSSQHYWYVTDAINLLRAVFIFIIFCCKRKVFRLLKQRLFPSLASKNTNSRSNGTRKSSSSTQQSSLQSVQMTQINGNANVDPNPTEHP